jgi:serine/threonine protein kinase
MTGRHGHRLCQGCAVGPRVLNDRYELRSLLGRGGTAEVWLGLDRWLGRTVAVKLLHEELRADPALATRFEREARTVAGLSHPNIVAVHDVGDDRGVLYLVMEHVEGRSLARRLAESPMTVAETLTVAVQVCSALEAAAEAGVVHRDVTPANILLTADGLVKVCDFGLARLSGTARGSLSNATQMIGTCTFMAPEQVTGSTVDSRTDLYGLGCVLYAMLTGVPPFIGDTPMEIAWRHVEDTAEPASAHRDGIPAELDRLVLDLLAKYPADRPSTPAQVLTILRRLSRQPDGIGRSHLRPIASAVAGATAVAVMTAALIGATRPARPGPHAAPAVSQATPPSPAPVSLPVPPSASPSASPSVAATVTRTATARTPAPCRARGDQSAGNGRKVGQRACPPGARG